MKKIKILIAIDDFTAAGNIIKTSCSFFNKENSEITLINVSNIISAENELYNLAPKEYIEHTSEKSNIYEIEEYFNTEGFLYKGFIQKEGIPAKVIIDTVNKEGYDLVVVGSHNKGNLERFLLGSVSHKVSLHSKSSVLIVKNPFTEKDLSPEKTFKVLFAVDNSEFHNKMIEKIAHLIDIKRAKFNVLNVTPDLYSLIPPDAYIYTDVEKIKEATEKVSKDTINNVSLNLMKRHGIVEKKYHIEGDAAETIMNEAQKEKVDLTVVGSRGKTAFSGWLLGSVSSKISAYSEKIILILKK